MTTRFLIPTIATLACAVFVAACGSSSVPSKACIEAARLYAEALDADKSSPDGEKSADNSVRKQALAGLEERKEKLCPP